MPGTTIWFASVMLSMQESQNRTQESILITHIQPKVRFDENKCAPPGAPFTNMS